MENTHNNCHNSFLSSTIGSEFVKAMIHAQSEFSVPIFDKMGARNKYATLKSIMNATFPALQKHGLWFTQRELYCAESKQIMLETRITHISGQYISSLTPLNVAAAAPGLSEAQKYGCALSYAKRYSAMTILGLYADEEDEDNYTHEVPKVAKKDIDDLIAKINVRISKDPNFKEKLMHVTGGLKNIYDITKDQYQLLLKIVNQ